MARLGARRRGGRKHPRSGATAPAQCAVDRFESRPVTTGSQAGSSAGHSSGGLPSRASHPSDGNPSTASQQGSHGARVSEIPDRVEILSHALIRGFRVKTVKSLLRFLQRRATATTGGVVESREVCTCNYPPVIFRAQFALVRSSSM